MRRITQHYWNRYHRRVEPVHPTANLRREQEPQKSYTRALLKKIFKKRSCHKTGVKI